MGFFDRPFLYLLIVGSLEVAGQAQLEMPKRGGHPNGLYRASDVDKIDAVGGGVGLTVPIAGLPSGRGGSDGFTLNLHYSSQLFDVQPSYGLQQVTPSEFGGWRYGYEYRLVLDVRTQVNSNCSADPGATSKIYRLRLVSPDGSAHVLHPKIPVSVGNPNVFYTDACGDGFYSVDPDGYDNSCGYQCMVSSLPDPLVYYTTDGSFLRLEMSPVMITVQGVPQKVPWLQRSWTLFLPNGSRVGGQGRYSWIFLDRNSNAVQVVKTLGTQSQPTVTIGDQPGRAIVITMPTSGTVDTIQVQGYGGVARSTRVNWTTFSLASRTYSCAPSPAVCYFSAGRREVGSIEYDPIAPQTTTRFHTFEYYDGAGWGEMKKQVLPSGLSGQYQYSFREPYPTPPDIAINPVISKTITYSEENPNPPGVGAQSVRTEVWGWNYGPSQVTETAPDGGVTTTTFLNPAAADNAPSMPRLVSTIIRPNGDRVDRIWAFNRPSPRSSIGGAVDNPFLAAEYQSLSNGSSLMKSKLRRTEVDKNGNTTRSEESSYFDYPGGGFASNQACSSFSTCSLLRTVTSAYHRSTPVSTDTSNTTYGYWNASTGAQGTLSYTLNAVSTATVTGSGGNGMQVQYDYDDAGGRANVTAQRRCTAAGTECLQESRQYDIYGNLEMSTSPASVQTKLEYPEIAEAGADGRLYPRKRTEGYGSSTPRTFEMTWDRYTGAMKTENDVENNIVRTLTYDVIGRPVTVTEAGGTSGQSGYLRRAIGVLRDDAQRTVAEYRDRNTFLDAALISVSRTDAKGETRLVQGTPDSGTLNTADSSSGARVDRRAYLAPGSAYYTLESSAFQSWTDGTFGWTRTKFDRMRRPVEVAHFNGSTLPSPFNNGGGLDTGASGVAQISYNLNTVTTTDEALKSTTSTYDGLGRLVTVVQGGATTNYTYDALGNLTETLQSSGGYTQKRVFEYDHHSRLKKAWMPETSPDSPGNPSTTSVASNKPTSYTYYNDGTVQTKTDARGVVTNYTYDHARGLLLTKTYSDGTPAVTFTYTAGGRMASATAAGVSATTFTYDTLGRYSGSTQTTLSTTFPFGDATTPGYQWNLADGLTAMKAPSGKLYTWTMTPANRPQFVFGGGYGYAQVTEFTAGGEPKSLSFASGMTETVGRNGRGQVTSVSAQLGTTTLLELTNVYEPTTNNGNLKSQTILPLGRTQTFTYDGKNQLESAVEQPVGGGAVSWSQTFGYDDFGNRWVAGFTGSLPGGGPRPNGPAWYQIPVAGQGLVINNRVKDEAYDAAGNQLSLSGLTGAYDAENRLKGAGPSVSFSYDAFGRRVGMVANGKTTVFVYNAMGGLTAEYVVGQTAGTVKRYMVQDQLGSTRLVTDAVGGVLRRSDYLPYGEEIPGAVGGRTLAGYGADGGVRQGFTGQERDAETGLDYFVNRYMSSALGRFTSVDPGSAGARLGEVQSWNGYAYAGNNPLLYIDPLGMDYHVCDRDGRNCTNITDEEYDQSMKAIQGGIIYVVKGDGTILAKNDDGSTTRVGKATYFNKKVYEALEGAGQTSGTVVDARFIAGWYGASAVAGYALSAGGVLAGGEVTSLGGMGSGVMLTNPEAASIIGWGTSQAGASTTQALARGLTKAAVEQMKRRGLNRMTVDRLVQLYENGIAKAAQTGVENRQLVPRLELMRKIRSLW